PNVNLAKDVSKIFQYEHTDECLIEGVKRFPAGSYAWYRDKSLNIVKWWNTLDNLTEVPHDYNAQVEQFRALFFDACKIRMRSDVPIGTALSGGLDSSAVISCLKNISAGSNERVSRDWQHAFIASFPGTPLDETYYAKKVTGHIGIKETVIEIDPLKYIDKLDDFLFLFEDNYITSPIPFMLTYNAIKSNNVKVSIDGHGADELFGGYPFNILSALNDNFYNFKNVSMILDAYYGIFPVEKSQLNIRQESRTRFLIKWYARGFLRQIKKALKTIAGFKPEKRRLDSLNEVLYNETHLNILPTLLRNYDRYSMSNGVEIRMPFMDHRIVSFAFSIPWSSKIRNGFTKSIVRDAMEPYMPQEIAYRRT
ncbi:MAG TPA: asparagine synthetase B family protein, partial [Candidatus Wallbacteria bacterium]|nr:asparagine synthetase B family protein [Candidatus Wallbacteria bacterium]